MNPIVQPRPLAAAGQLTDAELASRVRLGDLESMDEIVRRHWRGVVDYSARFAEDLDSAKDLAQDTFLALWENTVGWKETGSLRAFLFGVARNFARNRGRRWREVRVLTLVGAPTDHGRRVRDPLEEVEGAEVRRLVEAAVAALPARRQEIFILARVHGLTHAEIAQTLRLSSQTVANQMGSALADLRRRLAPLL